MCVLLPSCSVMVSVAVLLLTQLQVVAYKASRFLPWQSNREAFHHVTNDFLICTLACACVLCSGLMQMRELFGDVLPTREYLKQFPWPPFLCPAIKNDNFEDFYKFCFVKQYNVTFQNPSKLNEY